MPPLVIGITDYLNELMTISECGTSVFRKLNEMKKIAIGFIVAVLGLNSAQAQNQPQFSQYMYNPMAFNPGYAGTGGVMSALASYRTQWVGLDGAPQTISFSGQSPLGEYGGIGVNIFNDQIGPSKETTAMINASYTIVDYDNDVKYSFGVSAGGRQLQVDFNKLNIEHGGDASLTGSLNRFSPNVGVGLFVHTEEWYVGLSVPYILNTKFYDDVASSVTASKPQFYGVAGYVFEINPELKFKPATMIRAISGAPLSIDVSANFLISDMVTLGASYRWDAAVSALAGFQISEDLQIGYSYDFDTNKLGNYNSGSHEIFIRFDLFSKNTNRYVNPRFF